jgi:hypothetical protein
MPLNPDAPNWSPPNRTEREILKKLGSLSAQIARLQGSVLGRKQPGALGLGLGEAPAGSSLYTSNDHGFNYLPSGLLDGGRRRRTKRSRRSRRTRRTRK